MQDLKITTWKVSPNELREILKNCQFLEKVYLCSLKLEELANEEIRTKCTKVLIMKSENEFIVGCSEAEYLVKDKVHSFYDYENYKQVRGEVLPREKFYSLEAVVDRLDQKGCLRNEGGQL